MNDQCMVINYKLEKNKKNYIQNLRNKEIEVKKKQEKLWNKTKPTLKKVLHFWGHRSVALGKVK